MIVIRTAFSSALVALVCTASALAVPYSELLVFGDSLSDVGNVFDKTDNFLFEEPIPASAYFDGRFSNGPVYSERLATALGLGTLTHSNAGGNNFAHGNAMTTGTGFPLNLFIDDIDDQVGDFLNSRTVDPDALFVVFAGANDLLDGETNVSFPVGNLISDINDLIGDGAENILVANLPLLGLTPRFNGDPGQSASMSALTESFNAALFTALDTLEASTPGVDFFRLDVAQLINDAVANPGAFGFVNVTDPAAPGLDFDSFDYDPNLIVDEPDTYLFWDELHPTTAAHALLAEYALDAVTFSADFDFDGQVDEIDLAMWEVSYGVNVLADADGDGDSDGLDFLEWQRQFGNGVSAIIAASRVVPEPTTQLIAVGLLLLGTVSVRGAPKKRCLRAIAKSLLASGQSNFAACLIPPSLCCRCWTIAVRETAKRMAGSP